MEHERTNKMSSIIINLTEVFSSKVKVVFNFQVYAFLLTPGIYSIERQYVLFKPFSSDTHTIMISQSKAHRQLPYKQFYSSPPICVAFCPYISLTWPKMSFSIGTKVLCFMPLSLTIKKLLF